MPSPGGFLRARVTSHVTGSRAPGALADKGDVPSLEPGVSNGADVVMGRLYIRRGKYLGKCRNFSKFSLVLVPLGTTGLQLPPESRHIHRYSVLFPLTYQKRGEVVGPYASMGCITYQTRSTSFSALQVLKRYLFSP